MTHGEFLRGLSACSDHTKNHMKSIVVLALVGLFPVLSHAAEQLFSNLTFRADWKVGESPWTNLNLKPPVTDWSGFDRIVLRIVNKSTSYACFGFYASDSKGRIQNGFKTGQVRLQPYERQCVVRTLAYGKGVDSRQIVRCMGYLEYPDDIELEIESVTLLRKGEKVPESDEDRRRDAEFAMRRNQNLVARLLDDLAKDAAEHRTSLSRFLADCRSAGTANAAFALGQATTMEHVRPRAAFSAKPADEIRLRLAQNEGESVQLVVAQTGGSALERVRAEVGTLSDGAGRTLPAAAVRVAPLGYVLTREVPPYRRGRKMERVKLGWWPDPILDFPLEITVKDGDAQSFLLRVRCPKSQPAGVYRGTIRVSAECGGERFAQTIPLTVRVNGFALPDEPAMPLVMTFVPRVQFEHMSESYRREKQLIFADPEAPVHIWRRHRREWTDFLSDYYITTDSIAMEEDTYDTHPHPDFDELKHLQAKGRLGLFNLGYWHTPGKGEKGWAKWCDETLGRIRRHFDAARAAGLLDHTYIYGCDELSPELFPNMLRAIDCLKREFPGVPLFTTSYDSNYGTGDSPLGKMDWFCPNRKVYDPKIAARARAEGHKVWWYVTCSDPGIMVESLPIDYRLMMGAMAAKMKPDGFLYWQMTCWNSQRPISSGPFTDWQTMSYSYYHGDGYLVACGPDGIPLPTQRLENFRDGLEDLAYVELLRRRRPGSALLKVPADVVKNMTDYTEDPAALLRWRNAIADELEAK